MADGIHEERARKSNVGRAGDPILPETGDTVRHRLQAIKPECVRQKSKYDRHPVCRIPQRGRFP